MTVSLKTLSDGELKQSYKYLGYYASQPEALNALAHFNENPYDMDADQEIETLWSWSDKNEYISIILMMIYSGVRIGELRDLEKAKTPAGIRNVPIANKVMPFFRYWMQKADDCKYLITTREGRYFHDKNFRDSYWKPMIEELGLNPDHKPHDTRHTCVSLLVKEGVDERLIKKIVGHAGKGITEQVYTHLEMEQLIDTINKI